jgi:DNA-directed RNA polymerase subunit K/omega
MADTLPLEEIEKHADNIFEAIVIIAKRARQINDYQKRLVQDEVENNLKNDNFDDEGVNRDLVDRQFLKFPNPTSIAMQELIQGKLSRDYPGSSES